MIDRELYMQQIIPFIDQPFCKSDCRDPSLREIGCFAINP